ncbi:MAG: hypothetical protein ACM3H9_09830 [Rhodospirillaceae bacterium]
MPGPHWQRPRAAGSNPAGLSGPPSPKAWKGRVREISGVSVEFDVAEDRVTEQAKLSMTLVRQ